MGNMLELMIPPTKRLGSVVVTRPASHGEVPGSNPGLVILFSLTQQTSQSLCRNAPELRFFVSKWVEVECITLLDGSNVVPHVL